jgi:hypothetical protein
MNTWRASPSMSVLRVATHDADSAGLPQPTSVCPRLASSMSEDRGAFRGSVTSNVIHHTSPPAPSIGRLLVDPRIHSTRVRVGAAPLPQVRPR